MKLPEGDRLQDAIDLFHDDSWCGVNKPELYADQVARLLVIWERWFRDEFAPKRRPAPASKPTQSRWPKKPPRRTDPATSVITLVKRRATKHGVQLCEVCGVKPGTNAHHRQPRGMGGSREEHINAASNLLWVCGHGNAFPGCHADIENDRDRAKDMGWLVSRPALPAKARLLRRGEWVRFNDQGGMSPAPDEDEDERGVA